MKLERLEKIREWTDEIDKFIYAEIDNTSIHLKSKLKEFSEALKFEIKNQLFEEYQKEREIKQTTTKSD